MEYLLSKSSEASITLDGSAWCHILRRSSAGSDENKLKVGPDV